MAHLFCQACMEECQLRWAMVLHLTTATQDVLVARWKKGLSAAMDITASPSPLPFLKSPLGQLGQLQRPTNMLLMTQHVLSCGGSVSH